MYMGNLTESFRIRFSETDMNFLRKLSDDRGVSVSECVRSIIGEYRRSLETLEVMRSVTDAVNFVDAMKQLEEKVMKGELSNGDTKTNIDDKL